MSEPNREVAVGTVILRGTEEWHEIDLKAMLDQEYERGRRAAADVGPLLERLDQQTAEIERLRGEADEAFEKGFEQVRGRCVKAEAALAAAQARAAELEYQLAMIRDRAGNEIADAKEGEAYHAEINSGLGLVAEQSRRSAWDLSGDAARRPGDACRCAEKRGLSGCLCVPCGCADGYCTCDDQPRPDCGVEWHRDLAAARPQQGGSE